jgi:hypothetical protein
MTAIRFGGGMQFDGVQRVGLNSKFGLGIIGVLDQLGHCYQSRQEFKAGHSPVVQPPHKSLRV